MEEQQNKIYNFIAYLQNHFDLDRDFGFRMLVKDWQDKKIDDQHFLETLRGLFMKKKLNLPDFNSFQYNSDKNVKFTGGEGEFDYDRLFQKTAHIQQMELESQIYALKERNKRLKKKFRKLKLKHEELKLNHFKLKNSNSFDMNKLEKFLDLFR